LKRSNRLIFLIGILLAVVAGVGAFFLLQGPDGTPEATPAVTTVVEAAVDIPLGTRIVAGMVVAKEYPLDTAPTGGYTQTSQVIGQTVRTDVAKGQMITTQTFTGSSGSVTEITPLIDSGKRAMAVRVDQTTGVGTLIKPGDHVDMVVAYTIQLYERTPEGTAETVLTPQKSVKVVLQNLEVLGTLLPPPDEDQAAEQPGATPEPGQQPGAPTTLNDQQQIVIVAVDPQQAEVIKFAQAAEPEAAITLILRSADDYTAVDTPTTGIILKLMVDNYGVLPPLVDIPARATPRPTPRP
jgi:pilus assembly protein CpaB